MEAERLESEPDETGWDDPERVERVDARDMRSVVGADARGNDPSVPKERRGEVRGQLAVEATIEAVAVGPVRPIAEQIATDPHSDGDDGQPPVQVPANRRHSRTARTAWMTCATSASPMSAHSGR